MRRRIVAPVLALALLAGGEAQAGTLERGNAEFWSGGVPCGDRCWEHALDVGDGGFRLRIGIDHVTIGDVWRLEVRDPSGQTVSQITPGIGLYSQEGFVDSPAPGRWTARAIAEPDVGDLRFRARAALEREPAFPIPAVAELPNLQALPPWDLSFRYPVSNGTSDPPVGLDTPGGRASCHAEELAVRCLRMAFGVRNTGRGPMDLSLGEGETPEDRPLIQTIHSTDGSTTSRDAGRAVHHTTHGHYHHDQAIGLQLLRVAAPGQLAPAGDEHRKGFAHRDEILREWGFFHPDIAKSGFGLKAGWGDYYEWDRPGNYVDFGLNGDGRYVLRMTADPVGGILESNEADNVAYTLIEVAGTAVTAVESGRGSDPWDRCRILTPIGAEFELPAGLAQHPRPADCPLDTIDPDPPVPLAPLQSAAAPVSVAPKPAAKRKRVKRRCVKRAKVRKRGQKKRRCVKWRVQRRPARRRG